MNRAVQVDEDDDHCHSVANSAKGEQPGEQGLNKGYRPGRKTANKRKKNSCGPRPQ